MITLHVQGGDGLKGLTSCPESVDTTAWVRLPRGQDLPTCNVNIACKHIY